MSFSKNADQSQLFYHMTALANQAGAVNLSQGVPVPLLDDDLTFLLKSNIASGTHQYIQPKGLPELQVAIKQTFLPEESDLDVFVSNGATTALFSAFRSFLNAGDEVLLIEPFYSYYPEMIKMCGACPRVVCMDFDKGQWSFSIEKLEQHISQKTKMLVVNSPNNPTSFVFSKQEQQDLVNFCKQHDLFLVCDEVYSSFCYDDFAHQSFSHYSSDHDKIIVVNSISKMFCAAGWRVGWALAQEEHIKQMTKVHAHISHCVPVFIQKAVVELLAKYKVHESFLQDYYAQSRDLLFDVLLKWFPNLIKPKAGWYFCCEIPKTYQNNMKFAEALTKEFSMTPLPLLSFFLDKQKSNQFVRFSFSQSHENLERLI